jgi:hypothetical protein
LERWPEVITRAAEETWLKIVQVAGYWQSRERKQKKYLWQPKKEGKEKGEEVAISGNIQVPDARIHLHHAPEQVTYDLPCRHHYSTYLGSDSYY